MLPILRVQKMSVKASIVTVTTADATVLSEMCIEEVMKKNTAEEVLKVIREVARIDLTRDEMT